MDQTKDFGHSVVRTILLPAVIMIGTRLGLNMGGADLDGDLEFVIEVAAGYVGYTVIRGLEVFTSPKWGYVLGLSQKSPSYEK